MKTSKVLLKAMDVIATPDKWTKGHWARDKDDSAVLATNPRAKCWCSLGALNKALEKSSTFAFHAEEYLVEAMGKQVAPFNDSERTNHSDVMEKFMTAAFLALANGD